MSHLSFPNINALPEDIQSFLAGLPETEANYVLCHAPECLIPWTNLIQSIYTSTLSYKYLEVGMLRQAYRSGCSYALHHQKQIAKCNGMTDDVIRYICSAKVVTDLSAEENSICQAADELEETATISNATYHQLQDLFNANELVEIVVAISFYCCVARFLNATRVKIEAPEPSRIERKRPAIGVIPAVA